MHLLRWLMVIALVGIGSAVAIEGDRIRHLAVPVVTSEAPVRAATQPVQSLPAWPSRAVMKLPSRVTAFVPTETALLVATFDEGLFRQVKGMQPERFGDLHGRERFVSALARQDGRVWVGTFAGVVVLTEDGRRIEALIRDAAVDALIPTGDLLLAGTSRGVFLLSPGRARPVLQSVRDVPVRATALALNGGSLFVGSPRGVYLLDATVAQGRSSEAKWVPLVFARSGDAPGTTNGVVSLATFGDGVIVGTDDGGLVLVGPDGRVQAVRLEPDLANLESPGAALALGGFVLVGSEAGGLLRIGPGVPLAVAAPAGMPSQITALAAVPSGALVGTGDGSVLEMETSDAAPRG